MVNIKLLSLEESEEIHESLRKDDSINVEDTSAEEDTFNRLLETVRLLDDPEDSVIK